MRACRSALVRVQSGLGTASAAGAHYAISMVTFSWALGAAGVVQTPLAMTVWAFTLQHSCSCHRLLCTLRFILPEKSKHCRTTCLVFLNRWENEAWTSENVLVVVGSLGCMILSPQLKLLPPIKAPVASQTFWYSDCHGVLWELGSGSQYLGFYCSVWGFWRGQGLSFEWMMDRPFKYKIYI